MQRNTLLASAALAAALLVSPASAQGYTSSVDIPSVWVGGQPFFVELEYAAGDADAKLEAWRLGPSAFEASGEPLAERGATATIDLPEGSTMTLRLDLSAYLPDSNFELGLAGAAEASTEVTVYQPAAEGLTFADPEGSSDGSAGLVPLEELDDYVVLMQTNQGPIMLEFWPNIAPKHVRNFLDLCHTGFYEGVLFHRVSPNFMIQGGDPNTKADDKSRWGQGGGPRRLEAEFSDKQHVRGVLSMARGGDPNSASSQFFLMTKDSLFLDNKYSAFGKMVSGFDALDAIASADGKQNQDGTVRPSEPQRIEKALVLRRPNT